MFSVEVIMWATIGECAVHFLAIPIFLFIVGFLYSERAKK